MADLAESVESMEQLAVAWRALVLDRDAGADVRDLPGIAVRWADCGFAFWNCVTLTDVGADARLAERRLGEAAEIMRAKRQPGFLWLFEELLDEEPAPPWTRRPSGPDWRTPFPVRAWRATCSRFPNRRTLSWSSYA